MLDLTRPNADIRRLVLARLDPGDDLLLSLRAKPWPKAASSTVWY